MKTHKYLDDIKKICANNHCSVDDIFEEVLKTHPKVGRSTIYRNVEEMVEEGILTKIVGVGNKALYELSKGNHIHLIDTQTGEIMDLDMSEIHIPGIPKNFQSDFADIKIYGEFVS